MSWECIGQKLIFFIDLTHLTFISNPVTQVRSPSEQQKNLEPSHTNGEEKEFCLGTVMKKVQLEVGQRGWEKHKGSCKVSGVHGRKDMFVTLQ